MHTVDGKVLAPPCWLVDPAKGCKNSSSGHVFRIYLIQFSYGFHRPLPKIKGCPKFVGGGRGPPAPHFGGVAFGHAPFIYW